MVLNLSKEVLELIRQCQLGNISFEEFERTLKKFSLKYPVAKRNLVVKTARYYLIPLSTHQKPVIKQKKKIGRKPSKRPRRKL